MSKLDKEQLLELQDYITMLDEQVGLDIDTLNDINKAINRELDRIQHDQNIIDYYNDFGHTA